MMSSIFDPFYTRPEEAFEDLKRRLEQEQAGEDGSYAPIILFAGVSEDEKVIVDEEFERATREFEAMFDPEASKSDKGMEEPIPPEMQNATPPSPMLYPFGGVDPMLALTLWRHRNDSGKTKKANSYILMQKVLAACDIRLFEGRFYVRVDAVFDLRTDEELKTLLFYLLEGDVAVSGGPQVLRQVLELLKSYPKIQMQWTTEDAEHIYFRNGCLNAVSGTFGPSGPMDFFVTYLDFNFASSGDAGCPRFDAYLQTISGGDPAIIECIWEMLGYLIMPDMNGKCFFLLCGVGDSGKSVLGDLIASLFNPNAVAHIDIFRFKDRFSGSGLEGCRLNISMDLPNAKLSREAVGMLKMLTGDDGVTLEQKFKDAHPKKPKCKLVFGSNFPLQLASMDEAFVNRVVCIPLRYAVTKEHQDPNLREKLRAERAGIVVRAIAAYWRLVHRNYIFPLFRYGSMGVRGYIPQGDVMEDFLNQRCCFRDDAFTATEALLAEYNIFCEEQGIPGIYDGAQFSRQLRQYCGERIRSHKKRVQGKPKNGYFGIKLADEDDQ